MLELTIRSADVAVLLSAMEFVAEDAVATIWGSNSLLVSLIGRNGPRTFNLTAAGPLTMSSQPPAQAVRASTIAVTELSRLLCMKGNLFRVSLDPAEGSLAVTVMCPGVNAAPSVPETMRIAKVTAVTPAS